MTKRSKKDDNVVEIDKRGREVKHKVRNDLGISDEEMIEALLRNPATYEFADLIPDPERHLGGRPRIYPKHLIFVVACVNDIKKSARAAETAMKGERFWRHMQDVVAEMFPDDTSMHLPDRSPDRTWFAKTLRRKGMDVMLDGFRHQLTTTGIETAVEIGCPITDNQPWEPALNRMIAFDGKVIKSATSYAKGDEREVRLLDKTTGELTTVKRQRRHDPDAKFHMQGDKRRVRGNKFAAGWIRDVGEYQSAVLFVDHVPDEKGKHNSEGDVMMKNFGVIEPLLPGNVGVITDTVSRGVHLDEMQREWSWVPFAPIAAAKVDKKTGERLAEKEGFIRSHAFKNCTRGSIEIWHQGGWLTKGIYDESGKRNLVRLEWLGDLRRKNKKTYRMYVEYRAVCSCGEHTEVIRERTHSNDEDKARGFNRAENVRLVPPGSKLYDAIYGRRQDAESQNRRIDDYLPLRRARSFGWQCQLFDLVAHAHVVNSIAKYRWGSSGTMRRDGATPPDEHLAA